MVSLFVDITDIDQYQLGTLSHLINARAHGYQELPEWPEVAPDPSVRNVSEPVPVDVGEIRTRAGVGKKKTTDLKSFYSEDESTEEGESIAICLWVFCLFFKIKLN